jgi:hypothetical protein
MADPATESDSAATDVASGWRDERGCITQAGLDALREAPVGQAPNDLAEHVAGCKNCQYRMLSGGRPRSVAGTKPRGPLLWRVVLFAIVGLALALMTLLTMRSLLVD